MFLNILNYCKVISDGIQNKQFPCYIFIQYSSKGKENYNNFLMVRKNDRMTYIAIFIVGSYFGVCLVEFQR